MSAVYAERVPDEDKASLIVGALNKFPRPRLTLNQLIEATGMSEAQVRKGWKHLRATLGEQIACMKPAREHSTYFLSEEFNDGADYMFWQTRHLYTRVVSARHTMRAISQIGAHMPDLAESLEETKGNLDGAWSNLRGLLRNLATRIEVDELELERILLAGMPATVP